MTKHRGEVSGPLRHALILHNIAKAGKMLATLLAFLIDFPRSLKHHR